MSDWTQIPKTLFGHVFLSVLAKGCLNLKHCMYLLAFCSMQTIFYGRSNNNFDVGYQECLNLPPCDTNCELDDWATWSSCSGTCFNTILRNYPTRTRKRTKISEAVGKGLCSPLKETEDCIDLPNCPINGEWSEWSKSVDCDKICGEGVEIHKRQCVGQEFDGEDCTGESEKEVKCFQRDCFCELGEWSDWSRCIANENGCGDGKKSRSREKKNSEFDCTLRNGEILEEEKNCYTKHCTNEFFTLNKITLQILEAEYPGTSKEWKITIKDSNGDNFCTTSTISGLTRGLKKSITGTDLGVCGKAQKKLSLTDFKTMESLTLQIRPKEQLTDMRVTSVQIFVCNNWDGGSNDKWKIGARDHHCGMIDSHTEFIRDEWKMFSKEEYTGGCSSKQINNWGTSLYLNFRSDGTDDLALCKAKVETQGNFRSVKYYHDRTGGHEWANDDYGKNSEFIGFGPLNGNIKDNRIKVGSVQLDFCVSNCDNGIAQYKSSSLPDKFYNMANGFDVSLNLQDKRKISKLCFI